jgi:GNAT superfamily N-acetyltransferase
MVMMDEYFPDADYKIVEKIPSPKDYNRLRMMVGWGTYDEELVALSLPNSLFCVCAMVSDETIGMARIIGDGGLVFYIQDVIVIPEYQGKGIGGFMMERVMAYLKQHAGHNTILGLMSATGKEGFYEQYGFISRPTDKLGCGMTLFWE